MADEKGLSFREGQKVLVEATILAPTPGENGTAYDIEITGHFDTSALVEVPTSILRDAEQSKDSAYFPQHDGPCSAAHPEIPFHHDWSSAERSKRGETQQAKDVVTDLGEDLAQDWALLERCKEAVRGGQGDFSRLIALADNLLHREEARRTEIAQLTAENKRLEEEFAAFRIAHWNCSLAEDRR